MSVATCGPPHREAWARISLRSSGLRSYIVVRRTTPAARSCRRRAFLRHGRTHDELVAVDGGDVAVAEFLMKHALADRIVGDGPGRLATSSPSRVSGRRDLRRAAFGPAALHLHSKPQTAYGVLRYLLVHRKDGDRMFLEAAAVAFCFCARCHPGVEYPELKCVISSKRDAPILP